MRAVLHHFEDAAECAVFVADCRIQNVNKDAGFIDPKFRRVLFARSELFNNLFDDMHACPRVAVLNIPPDDVFAARKHAVFRIGVKANRFIFVYIRKIDR